MHAADAVLIGIDVGTSSCKIAAFDDAGRQLALVRSPLPTTLGPNGAAEQSAEDWWRAATSGLRQLHRQHLFQSGGPIAIGVCGHWPSTVLLDPDGLALRPAIVWMDTRCRLPAGLTVSLLADRVGLPSSYLPNLPVTKLAWLQQHEPDLFASGRLRWCLGTTDTVGLRLTGRAATDPLEAWWTGLAYAGGGAWDPALLAAIGLSPSALPEIRPMATNLGTVTRQAQSETGLPAHSLVAVGTGDGYCGLIGAGAEEEAVVIAGSSTIVAAHVPSDRPLPAQLPILRFPPFRLGRDVWYASLTPHPADALVAAVAGKEISAAARQTALGLRLTPTAPQFVPAPASAGGLALEPPRGDTLQPDEASLYRAALESVTFSVRYWLTAMTAPGQPAGPVRLAGGGAASPGLAQLYANDLGRPVVRRAGAEIGCQGAAALAAVAAGLYPDVAQAASRLAPPVTEVRFPEPAQHAHIEARYQRFLEALARPGQAPALPGLV